MLSCKQVAMNECFFSLVTHFSLSTPQRQILILKSSLPMASNTLGNLDIHLWSQVKLNPDAQDVLGIYQNLHPLRFNRRHIYWNLRTSHLLVFFHLGHQGSWTLCKWEGPRSTLSKLVARCRRRIKATYQTFEMVRSLWHGGEGSYRRLPLPAGEQFFFNRSRTFEDLLSEFAASPKMIQARLQFDSHQWRPFDTEFFMADISMKVGYFDRPPLNLRTLGTYYYHQAFQDFAEASPCWGAGYLPQLCCHQRISVEQAYFCFGEAAEDYLEHCCPRYRELPVGKVAVLPSIRGPLPSKISVQIFLQTYHEDKFALLPFLDSIDAFWPKIWNSTIFVAVDNTPADHKMCQEFSSRVTCIVTPFIPRGPSIIDSIEWSGRGASERYHKQLLQYHYWLSDLYIADHVELPDWIAWFDSDVVMHTTRVEELLMPFGLPVHFARRAMHYSMETMSLGLDWVGEFMDTFPQLVRPSHLRHFRDFVKKTFKKNSFEEAYQAWRSATAKAAVIHGKSYGYLSEGECPQSAFPNFLYHFHHDEYTWSLEDAWAFGLPLEDTCLAFRAASHLNALKQKVKEANGTQAAYQLRAKRLMQMGRQNSSLLHQQLSFLFCFWLVFPLKKRRNDKKPTSSARFSMGCFATGNSLPRQNSQSSTLELQL